MLEDNDIENLNRLMDSKIKAEKLHLSPSKETDKRLGSLENKLENMSVNCNKHNLNSELMRRDIEDIKKYMADDMAWKKDHETRMEVLFVTKTEFSPVKRVVYGVVVMVLTSFFAALITLIIK